MGKPLVRFCEGPGNNEGRWVRGTRHAVVACDEASNESLISVFDSHDYLETPVYSKIMVLLNLRVQSSQRSFLFSPPFQKGGIGGLMISGT